MWCATAQSHSVDLTTLQFSLRNNGFLQLQENVAKIISCDGIVAPALAHIIFNPNPGGWGRIWLPKLKTGVTPQRLK
jgi:hypothetical protein